MKTPRIEMIPSGGVSSIGKATRFIAKLALAANST
jgi:hypothetical protein